MIHERRKHRARQSASKGLFPVLLVAVACGVGDQGPPASHAIVLSKLRDEQAYGEEQAYGIVDAVVAILTQQHGRRPQAELDAFADSLVALAIAGNLSDAPGGPDVSNALVQSALPEEEGAIPYRGAYDALERVFAATESRFMLYSMANIDPLRAWPLLLELARRDDHVGCAAISLLYGLADEDDPVGELMKRRASESDCLLVSSPGLIMRDLGPVEPPPMFFPPYNDILAILRAGDETGFEHAANTLAQVHWGAAAYELDALADSLVALAASGGDASPVAGQVLDALELSARPVAGTSYAGAYDAAARLFKATGEQAALESLARIDADRAAVLLANLARRDGPESCKARAVLAGLTGGPRVLWGIEDLGGLRYRCDGGV